MNSYMRHDTLKSHADFYLHLDGSSLTDLVEGFFIELAERLKLLWSIALIYPANFCFEKPLCLHEVKEGTGPSKGWMTEDLNFLSQNGLVLELRYSMNRRFFYEPEMSLLR